MRKSKKTEKKSKTPIQCAMPFSCITNIHTYVYTKRLIKQKCRRMLSKS